MTATCLERCTYAFFYRPPKLERDQITTRLKLPARISPAALLNAGYWDLQLSSCSNEHRSIQYPILLGTPKFFTLEQENAILSSVMNQQVRHGSGLAHLFDHRSAASQSFFG